MFYYFMLIYAMIMASTPN